MSGVVSGRSTAAASPETQVIGRLAVFDRLLPVWVLGAMALGIGLGRAVPSLNKHLNVIQVTSGTSLPIFVGLLVMMYPVLAKVRYGHLGSVTRDRKMLLSSLVLNWVVGPAVMFALAWLLLRDQPAYRTGLIIVGLARCIAMVLVWNDLSGGDRESAAVLVAFNSLFQIAAFAFLGYFYLKLLPSWLGLSTVGLHLSVGKIAETVGIFLGIPLVAGFLTRTIGERVRGRDWYETALLPRLSPFALYGLLYTIVILFALQGHTITSKPLDVVRISLPLLAYFAIMWFGSFALGCAIGLPYRADRHLGVHGRWQQLRAGYRSNHRRVRYHERSSPRWSRGAPHRGPRPRKPGLCRPVAKAPLPVPPDNAPGGIAWLTNLSSCFSAPTMQVGASPPRSSSSAMRKGGLKFAQPVQNRATS